jgi:hypothetical protein
MKKVIAVALATISFSAHANHVYIDTPNCKPPSQSVHGACVQNKTGKVITGKLMMVEEIFYHDGSSSYGLYEIASLQANHYLDFAYTDQDFEKQKIAQVVYAVDYDGTPISGCIIQLTPDHPMGMLGVSIQHNGKTLSDVVCVS